jgi:antitoxin FitA
LIIEEFYEGVLRAPLAKPRLGGFEALTRQSRKTTMVPLRLETNMPTTLTLKNIPNDVYDQLKLAAQTHRRSMNSEAIVCLEAALLPAKVTLAERLNRARELRAALPPKKFRAKDIDAMKQEGRS